MRSLDGLPKSIAPNRPLPIGNASVSQSRAGLSYHRLVSAAVKPVIDIINRPNIFFIRFSVVMPARLTGKSAYYEHAEANRQCAVERWLLFAMRHGAVTK